MKLTLAKFRCGRAGLILAVLNLCTCGSLTANDIVFFTSKLDFRADQIAADSAVTSPSTTSAATASGAEPSTAVTSATVAEPQSESNASPQPILRPGQYWHLDDKLGKTIGKIPDYLPEGMVPPLTGETAEEHRHYGIGQPLKDSSWLDCSHSAGMFLGTIGGATLLDDHLEQGVGGLFGLRFGIDYDHHWGLEKRFGFAEMDIFDVHHHQRQIVNLELGDVDLLFYPWGDTRWRPYISTGAGLAHFNYESDTGRRIDRLLIGLPFGLGLKYFWNDGVAVRVEMADNLMLGTHELSTMNNISLSMGIEFRYKGFQFRKWMH